MTKSMFILERNKILKFIIRECSFFESQKNLFIIIHFSEYKVFSHTCEDINVIFTVKIGCRVLNIFTLATIA